MRKCFVFVAIIISIFLTSCSNSNENIVNETFVDETTFIEEETEYYEEIIKEENYKLGSCSDLSMILSLNNNDKIKCSATLKSESRKEITMIYELLLKSIKTSFIESDNNYFITILVDDITILETKEHIFAMEGKDDSAKRIELEEFFDHSYTKEDLEEIGIDCENIINDFFNKLEGH